MCTPGSGSCDKDLILKNACPRRLFPKCGFEGAQRLSSPWQMSVGAHSTQEPPAVAPQVPLGAAGGEPNTHLLLDSLSGTGRGCYSRDTPALERCGALGHQATNARPSHCSTEELDQPPSRGRGAGLGAGAMGLAPEHGLLSPGALNPPRGWHECCCAQSGHGGDIPGWFVLPAAAAQHGCGVTG